MKKAEKEYIYSRLSGFSVYAAELSEWDGQSTPPSLQLTDVRVSGNNTLLALPVYTADQPITDTKAAWFDAIIEEPASGAFFTWPQDLIEVARGNGYVGYLVYKNRTYRNMRPIRELLYQPSMSKVLDWRDPFILTVSRNFLTAMATLHGSGYIYNDFNMDHILYDPHTGAVFMKFSHSLRKSGSKTPYDTVDSAAISPEFAPPYVYNTDVYRGFLSKNTDCYQMVALLFRLWIGRLPYEGRDLMSYGTVFDPEFDTDENAHKYYFQQYHRYPHFIFDEADTTNALSATADNDLPRERWAALPEEVRHMFRNVLCQSTAERPMNKFLPTSVAWLKVVALLEVRNGREGSGLCMETLEK